jgi:bifunctional non-homologous end joining protein LigD
MAGMPRLFKPTLTRPMLASLSRELPANEEHYGWELKWDGLRAVAYVSGDTCRHRLYPGHAH